MHDSLFFYTTPFLFMSTDGPRRCNSIINEKQTSYWQLVINLFFENFGKIIVEERNDRRGYLGISSINIESEMYIDEKNIFFLSLCRLTLIDLDVYLGFAFFGYQSLN